MGKLRNSIVTKEPEHRVPRTQIASGETLGDWHHTTNQYFVAPVGELLEVFLAIFYLATACAAFGAAPAPRDFKPA